MKASALGGVVFALAASAIGGDFTWTGLGSGWSDKASWTVGGKTADAAPGAGDKAIIPSGMTATVADDDVDVAAAISDLQIDGMVNFANTGKACELKANLTGAGALRAGVNTGGKNDWASLKGFTLSGANENFTGEMTFSNAFVYVDSRHGLGSVTNAAGAEREVWSRNFNGDNGCIRFRGAGLTNDVNVAVDGGRLNKAVYLAALTDPLVFNGRYSHGVSFNQTRYGNWRFNGGIVGSTHWDYIDTGYELWVSNKVITTSSSYFNLVGGGKLHLAVGNNPFVNNGNLRWFSDVTIVCETDDPIFYPSYDGRMLEMANDSGAPILDLNGHNQTYRTIRADTQCGTSCPFTASDKRIATVASATPALITFTNGVGDFTMPIRFRGATSFKYANDGTYTIINQKSDTTGSLEVSSGTLAFDWNAVWAGPQVKINGTGKIHAKTSRALGDGAAALVIEDDGVLEIDKDQSVIVSSVKVGETELFPGVYRAGDATLGDHLVGEGKLVVVKPEGTAETFTWTGAGADDSFSTPANWKDDKVPALTSGNDKIVFNAAGENARKRIVLDGDADKFFVYGIEFACATNCELVSAKQIVVGSGGVKAADVDSIVTNRIDAPISYRSADKAQWYFGTNSVTVFAKPLSGGVSATETACWKGMGEAILCTDNSDMLAQLQIESVQLRVEHSRALGATNRYTIVVHPTKVRGSGEARLVFAGAAPTNETPLAIGGDNSWQSWATWAETPTTPLVFMGEFCAYSGCINPEFTAHTEMRGGVTRKSGNFWNQGNGVVWVYDKPLVQADGTYFMPNGEWHFCVTGNSWNYVCLGKIVCEVDDCLTASDGRGLLSFGYGESNLHGAIDLNGHDQHVRRLCHRNTNSTEYNYSFPAENFIANSGGMVTSAKGGTLILTPGAGELFVNQVHFDGSAALTMAGDGGTNLFQRAISASTSTGALSVVSGTLLFKDGAGWRGAREVSVSGGVLGVDEASAPTMFGTKAGASEAALSLSDDGVLELAGGTNYVKTLVVDGKAKRAGFYFAADCADENVPAKNRLKNLSGAGVLRVLRNGPIGTCVLVR